MTGSSQGEHAGARAAKEARLSHAGTAGFGLSADGQAPPPLPQSRSKQRTVKATDEAARRARARPGLLILAAVLVVAGGIATAVVAGTVNPVGHFLNFYCGVFSLVALSISVMVGVATTDQLVLAPRQRVLAQAIHRAAAYVAVTMLVVHVIGKVASAKAQLVDAFVPGLAQHRPLAVGLGTIAAYLMILVSAGGVFRAQFVGTGRPWLWRWLHAVAYVAWPLAIVHGLTAGRPAATWVTLSYILCALAVVLALPMRLITRRRAGRER